MTLPTPRLPMRTEPWPRGPTRTTCPLCGGVWFPFAGSVLPAHAKCLFTEEEKAMIRAYATASTKPLEAAATEIGIPTTVLRSILYRRGRHKP